MKSIKNVNITDENNNPLLQLLLPLGNPNEWELFHLQQGPDFGLSIVLNLEQGEYMRKGLTKAAGAR